MAKMIRRSKLSGAYGSLVTKKQSGSYSVKMPSQGGRVVNVKSPGNAKFIAEAEALRQKLASK